MMEVIKFLFSLVFEVLKIIAVPIGAIILILNMTFIVFTPLTNYQEQICKKSVYENRWEKIAYSVMFPSIKTHCFLKEPLK
jgi:hypothetical protein